MLKSLLTFVLFSFPTFRYFFFGFCSIAVLGALYGLLLLPVLFSLWGPSCQIVPITKSARNQAPTPQASPSHVRRTRNSSRQNLGGRSRPRSNSESDDLSTIYEESHSYRSSHEIIVQPELVLETTTITSGHAGGTCSTSTRGCNLHPPSSGSPSSSDGNFVEVIH